MALGFFTSGHRMLITYWPIFAFAFSLFIGSIGVAIGATMWLAGKMAEQDAKRIELKEAILKEMREAWEKLYGRLDHQRGTIYDKIDELQNGVGEEIKELAERVTRLEAALENMIRERYASRPGRVRDLSHDP